MALTSRFTLGVLLLSFLSCVAQNPEAHWQNPLNLTNKFNKVLFADSAGNSFFLTSNKDGDLFIEKQSSTDAKPAFCTKVISSEKGSADFRHVFVLQNGFAVISSIHDKTAGTFTFYENTVSFTGELQSSTAKQILQVPYKKKEGEGTSQFLISPDKKRMAISYRAPESPYLTFNVFDDSFSLIGTENGALNKNSKHGLVGASDFSITNSGDIVFTVEKITINRKDWEGVEEWLFLLTSKSDQVDSASINAPEGKNFTSMDILVTATDVVIFGFYTDKYVPRGVYFGRFSLNGLMPQASSTTDLTKEMFVTPGALDATNGEPGLYRGAITIIPSPTGYYVINDPIMAQASSSPNGVSSLMYTLYTMNVISIDREGKVNWINSIFRSQRCVVTSGLVGAFGISTSVMLREDDFSLFGNAYTVIGNELVILLNDNKDNTPQSGSSKEITGAAKPKELTANMIVVKSDGTFSKTISSTKDGGVTRWHVGHSYIGTGYIYSVAEDGDNCDGVMVK